MPGLVISAKVRLLDAAPGVYADARGRGEAAHHGFVGQHRNGADVLVRHGDNSELVAHKALVLKDDTHAGDADETRADADTVVDRINRLSLKQAGNNLLELLWLVMNDLCQSNPRLSLSKECREHPSGIGLLQRES